MGKNRLKPTSPSNSTPITDNPTPAKQDRSRGIIIKILEWLFSGRYLENDDVVKLIPFFIYLIIIGIVYITNGNIADKKIREINKLNKELKELRAQYIITKSELMFLSKQSEIAKRTEALGIKESTQQPYLILADSTISIY